MAAAVLVHTATLGGLTLKPLPRYPTKHRGRHLRFDCDILPFGVALHRIESQNTVTMTNRAFLPSISFHNSAHQLAIALIAVSVVHGLLGTAGLLLIPAATLNNLELWRPFTALLVALNPVEIIFGALIIYSIGGALEQGWGKRRFLTVALGIPFLAELATLATYAILPLNGVVAYHGASMIISTIWIAYGLRAAFSRQLLNFWGSPLKGETFALI